MPSQISPRLPGRHATGVPARALMPIIKRFSMLSKRRFDTQTMLLLVLTPLNDEIKGFCPFFHFLGHQGDQVVADRNSVYRHNLVPLPAGLPPWQGCPPVHLLDQGGGRPGGVGTPLMA